MVHLEPVPGISGVKSGEYILDKIQGITCHCAHSFTFKIQLKIVNPPTDMFLGVERKPETLEETHQDKRNTEMAT